MSRLSLFLLGMPCVERDGEPVQIPRRKAGAPPAYLAMTSQSHSRDVLATLLWPEVSSDRRIRLHFETGYGDGEIVE